MVDDDVGPEVRGEGVVPGARLGIDHGYEVEVVEFDFVAVVQIQGEVFDESSVFCTSYGSAVCYVALYVGEGVCDFSQSDGGGDGVGVGVVLH